MNKQINFYSIEIMRFKLLVIVIGMFVVTVVGWFIFDRFNIGKLKLNFPLEISTSFDPSVNNAMYAIEDVDAEKKELKLRFLWPKLYLNVKVTSKIYCTDEDIIINTKEADDKIKTERVSVKTLFEAINTYSSGGLVFSGKCSDKTCEEIVRDCSLTVIRGGQQ